MSLSGMVDRKIRGVLGVSLLAVLAACSSTDTKGLFDSAKKEAQGPAVVQGACPKIELREGTAYHRAYARGARKMADGQRDPEKLIYQAAIADTTRGCTISESGMTITIQAKGRIVLGPVGKSGTTYKVPVRVAVADENAVLYSQLTEWEVTVPTGQLSNQFLFEKTDVTIPGGAGKFAKVFVGFDDGPK